MGEAPKLSPLTRLSNPDYVDNDKPFSNNELPIRIPRTTDVKNICGIELRKPINSVNTEGQWKRVKVGVDSCAAISCTPEGTFPGPIEVTPQVGEEYTTANDGIIYNQGQQRVEGYTDDYAFLLQVPSHRCQQTPYGRIRH